MPQPYDKKQLLDLVGKQSKEQITIRRHLHQNPELSFEEIKTTEFLTKEIKSIGLKLKPFKFKTGLIAELKGAKPGPTIAIRTDIDALPILECSGVSFASKVKGKMHACGHDVHMSTVLGTARVLAQLKESIHGSVRFLFQPAEEQPPGGAEPMIQNGALDDVKMILGLHVDPTLPAGKISLRDGVTMASVTDFDLIVTGAGGHAARPHTAVDAIVTAAEIIESIQKIVSRETDPGSPVVITFGKIEGGTARNVIADRVNIVGTARTLSKDTAKSVPRLIKRTAEGICRARGAKVEMKIIAGYPVLSNNVQANRLLEKNFAALYSQKKIELTDQTLGGEDFARYLELVPGAMFRLGTRNSKIAADKGWHSPYFKVDESAMPIGTALLAASAIDYLNSKSE